MQRFRTTWVAVMGGALLVTLSVSAAFGAAPSGTTEASRGQTIASFVHELVFGADEGTDDEVTEEGPESDGDEESSDEGTDDDEELAEEDDTEQIVEGEDGDVAGAHGECVSEEASDKTDEDPEVDGNHGAVVSDAAQHECWEPAEDEEVTEPEDEEDPLEETVEEFANHGECVSAAAHDWEGFEESEHMTHGKWVSEHARYTCWGEEPPEDEGTEADTDTTDGEAGNSEASAKEQRKADRDAARAERKAERDAAKADRAASRGGDNAHGNGHGNGNGRGGGRP